MVRSNQYGSSNNYLYDDDRVIIRIHPIDRTGSVVVSEELTNSQIFLLQSVDEQDSEKVQVALSDSAKLYAFGKQHRFYTFTGKILDSDLTAPISEDGLTWNGRSYTEFVDFFENQASLSACARDRKLVGIYYAGKIAYGAVNQMTIVTNSAAPHEYDVVMSFFVVDTSS